MLNSILNSLNVKVLWNEFAVSTIAHGDRSRKTFEAEGMNAQARY